MLETGKMYLTNTTDGTVNTKLTARKALAPIFAYYATISILTSTHVTIISHTVMAIFFLIMAYCIYYYLGKKLFKTKDSIYIFLIILSFLNFYAFSAKGSSKYLILYTWFGRSVLAGVILPLLWLTAIEVMNTETDKFFDWIKIFIIVLASCLATEMAEALVPISLGTFALVSSIKDKRISYIWKSLICIIPCIVIGIIYIMIK